MSDDKWLEDEVVSTETKIKDEEDGYVLGEEDPVDTSVLTDDAEDPEIEAIKARVKEMEEEAAKLKEMQKEADAFSPSSHGASSILSPEQKGDIDSRSVYVGNVDYSATAAELEQHFHGCGSVNRVTILCDKFSGHPKGYSYVEFGDKESVENAVQLNESLFKGRQIKVNAKRTNVPGVSSTNRFPRSRGRGRGFRGAGTSSYYGYSPRSRGRGARIQK